MPAYKQRVFLSFTSEFLKYPEQDGSGQGSSNGEETFVAAAKRACSEMEFDCIEMGTFDPADCTPERLCEEKVRQGDLFLCLVGMNYGSRVNGRQESYVQFEYRVAEGAGLEKKLGKDHPHVAAVRGNLERLRELQAGK